MDWKLANINPKNVFHHFEVISRIPRESGHEEAVAKYIEQFAEKLGYSVTRDVYQNVVVEKPASKGYENHKKVILQGHTDMVCVKEDDMVFDFDTMPIPIVIDGEFIKAEGTTLGADDGIAVAMMMAILEDRSLVHPPLACLFTATEETGMDGVMGLSPNDVQGDILINIDSEEEGTVLTSCAGGIDEHLSLDVTMKPVVQRNVFHIVIKNLKGGHSGAEIHLGRANAIKLLGRTLDQLRQRVSFCIVELKGGEKMNAIAKRAEVAIACKADADLLNEELRQIEKMFKTEYAVTDPDVTIEMKQVCGHLGLVDYEQENRPSCDIWMIGKKGTHRIIDLLVMIPFGVQVMSPSIANLVQTSLNLGILSMKEPTKMEKKMVTTVSLSSSIRSSVQTQREQVEQVLETIIRTLKGRSRTEAAYPAWAFQEQSFIRDLMVDLYEKQFGKSLRVEAIHAGLECGFLKERLGEDIDMISLGPDLYDVHTPKERLRIDSVARVYDFLLNVLASI